MDVALLMFAGGIAAGLFGSLLGLGGGLLIVPVLNLGFDVPIREAVGVSLVCVIITSGASAAVFLRRGVADLRLGSLIELATAVGAVVGALIAFLLDERILAGMFAALLVYTSVSMYRASRSRDAEASMVSPDEPLVALPIGLGGGVVGGLMSAILGVGGGTVVVPVMHLAMKVPLRVAMATSNLMVGVTASASSFIYLARGGITPFVVGPTAVGVFLGAALGARIAPRVQVRTLRLLFVVVLLGLALRMAVKAIGPT